MSDSHTLKPITPKLEPLRFVVQNHVSSIDSRSLVKYGCGGRVQIEQRLVDDGYTRIHGTLFAKCFKSNEGMEDEII